MKDTPEERNLRAQREAKRWSLHLLSLLDLMRASGVLERAGCHASFEELQSAADDFDSRNDACLAHAEQVVATVDEVMGRK